MSVWLAEAPRSPLSPEANDLDLQDLSIMSLLALPQFVFCFLFFEATFLFLLGHEQCAFGVAKKKYHMYSCTEKS